MLALEAWQRHAERVAEDQLLERDVGAESQCGAAAAADRSRRQLDEPRPVLVPAQLRVQRALQEAEGARRLLGARGDRRLRGVRQARRRDVDRLLEERAVERVR